MNQIPYYSPNPFSLTRLLLWLALAFVLGVLGVFLS